MPAAGRYIQRLGISDTVHVGGNAPFQPASNVTRGSVDNPGGIGINATPLAFTSHRYTYPSPEAWGWNMTVEHDFPSVATFSLSYVGRRGYHLEQLANVNQLPPGTVQANPKGTNPDALRPYQGYSTIIEAQNTGGSFYHAMQVNLRRRLTHGFLFGAAYTWSKSLDYGSSNGTNITNAYDNSIMYGPSDFDTPHVLVVNYVWNIPFAASSSHCARARAAGGLAVLRNGPGSVRPPAFRSGFAKPRPGRRRTWFGQSILRAHAHAGPAAPVWLDRRRSVV